MKKVMLITITIKTTTPTTKQTKTTTTTIQTTQKQQGQSSNVCLSITSNSTAPLIPTFLPVGQVAGDLSFLDSSSSFHDATNGVLIPDDDVTALTTSRARRMIVIEKQATYQHVLSTGALKKGGELEDSIVVTGCGYPDYNTRCDCVWVLDCLYVFVCLFVCMLVSVFDF